MNRFKTKLYKEFSEWMVQNSIEKLQFFLHEDSVDFEDLILDDSRYDDFFNDESIEISQDLSKIQSRLKNQSHIDIIENLKRFYHEDGWDSNRYSSFFDKFDDECLYKKYSKDIKKFPWRYINYVFVTIRSNGTVTFEDHTGEEI